MLRKYQFDGHRVANGAKDAAFLDREVVKVSFDVVQNAEIMCAAD